MKQEHKELLLKDLCARLPYGVKFRYKYIDEFFHENYGTSTLTGVRPPYRIEHLTLVGNEYLEIEKAEIKPYLFPLSTMTKEQEEELSNLYIKPLYERLNLHTREEDLMLLAKAGYTITVWLLENHFDYLGLIPLDLAIDATGLNIY